MKHQYIDIANALTGKPCKIYTLDGLKDAMICDRLNKYATIVARDGTLSIEVNWPTVDRKMQDDGIIYAC